MGRNIKTKSLFQLFASIIFLLILARAQPAKATDIATCSVLDVQGETYTMTNDVSGAPNQGVCMVINASDVTLDCNGFKMTGTQDGVGVAANGPLTNVTVKNCSGISQYSTGVAFNATDNSTITNVTASGNLTQGIVLSSSSNNVLTNNTVFTVLNNSGFNIRGGSNNTLSNNSGNNFIIFGAFFLPSSNNTLTNNTGAQFTISGSTGNLLENNTGTGGHGDCFAITSGSSENVLKNNSASHCNSAFMIDQGSQHNIIKENHASDSGHGFRMTGGSTSFNTFEGNTFSNNTFNGFEIVDGSSNTFTKNTVTGSQGSFPFRGAGFEIAGGFRNSYTENSVSNNDRGFFIRGGLEAALSKNEIFANTSSGVQVNDVQRSFCCASTTSLEEDHLYGNNPDFRFGTSGGNGRTDITLTEVTFDKPGGNFVDYTTISLADKDFGEYSISWAAPPAVLPTGFISFAKKFINITPILGSAPIDSITWHWLDTELGDEGIFDIWKFTGNTQTDMNAALDTAANTLTISNLSNVNSPSVFGILQENPDDDFDGICDPGITSVLCTGSDNCPSISNSDQLNTDSDGLGDACDPDDDNDGIADASDAQPLNPDVCGDSDADTCDDCAVGTDDFGPQSDSTPNNDGPDNDQDGLCDKGDPDDDNDSVLDTCDNCQFIANTNQTNTDADTLGDACDPAAFEDVDGICPCGGPLTGEPANACSGPLFSGPWNNHGNYVSCVAHAADNLLAQGKITSAQKDSIVSAAGSSACGAK